MDDYFDYVNDSEDKRCADRVTVRAWKIAKDHGADFITQDWVAKMSGRKKTFVKKHWNMDFSEMHANFNGGRPDQLSQESKNIAISATGKRKRSLTSVSSKPILSRMARLNSFWTQVSTAISAANSTVTTNNEIATDRRRVSVFLIDFIR